MRKTKYSRFYGKYETARQDAYYDEKDDGTLITSGSAIDKLGQLEDGEEKLGIDLVIGVTALVNGIHTKQFGYVSGDSLVLEKYRIGIPSRSIALPFTGPAGYGKTWTLALAKEGSKA